jgi:hypothetical protein
MQTRFPVGEGKNRQKPLNSQGGELIDTVSPGPLFLPAQTRHRQSAAMIRRLLFAVILILAGFIGFMYFFGKGEDKTNAEAIVHDSKEVVKSIGQFLKTQKEKYDEGEFDRLINRVGKSIGQLKTAGSEKRDEVRQTLQDLQHELKQIDPQKLSEDDKQRLDKVLRDIEEALTL